jgi:MFS transporter, DHA3 family, macrolide efflux protein
VTGRSTLRLFGVVWAAQLVSVLGSSLSGFALGVWAYQRTGSVTQFALIFAANVLPGVVVAPFAGALADRFDRRWMLVIGDTGAAAATAVVVVLAATGNLQIWHIYLTTAVGASFTLLHRTAFYALVPVLVPKRHLGRANGLMQLGQAVTVAAPILAGVLLTTTGLTGVLMADLASFAVALGVLLAARLPAELTRPERAEPTRFRADLSHGWGFLARHRPLLLLVLFAAAYDLCFAFVAVLIRPLILGFASPTTLGVLEFLGGAGMIAGSLVLGAWGGTRRKLDGVVIFTALGGLALALHGLSASVLLIAVVAPLFLFTMPIVNGSVFTVLQLKVPGESMGRVTAAAQMVFQAAMPVGALVAGPLVDGVFEPLLEPGGALAGSVGALIGTGPGRGIALAFVVNGVLLVLLAAVVRACRPLYRIEQELPDAVPDPAGDGADVAEPVTR